MPTTLRAGLIAWAILACGCSGKRLYPVHGKVVYADGEVVSIGEVVAHGTGAEDGQAVSANGYIQPDGTFRLGSLRPGDGCPPGKYKVAVVAPAMPESAKPDFTPPQFHPRYANFETSGLEVVVEPRDNEVELKLDRAKGKGR